jgi:hypothetical protein
MSGWPPSLTRPLELDGLLSLTYYRGRSGKRGAIAKSEHIHLMQNGRKVGDWIGANHSSIPKHTLNQRPASYIFQVVRTKCQQVAV